MNGKDIPPSDLGISDRDWQQTPPAVRMVVKTLHERLKHIEEQLGLTSETSSKPPSSDGPGHKREQPARVPSGKKRGAQPGHPGKRREILPPDQVDELRVYKPASCQHCGERLDGEDAVPRRWQVTEIPPIRPVVIEHQIHRIACGCCGRTSVGQAPPEVLGSQFGPLLTGVIGLLSGEGRLSKRQVQQLLKTLLGVDISVGAVVARQQEVSASLATTYQAVAEAVRHAPNRNIDETPWDEAGHASWLWTAVGVQATVFQITPRRDRASAKALLGEEEGGITTSDRFSAYHRLDPERHQTCWAHLVRTFRRFQLRDPDSARVGGMLAIYADFLLHRWRQVRRGQLSRDDFLAHLGQHQADIGHWLQVGAALTHPSTARTCRQLLRHWPMLWTFTRYPDVEPTNNAAERALRHAVIWRKLCYGTASAAGSRFVERILSVVATARQQRRALLPFLYEAVIAQRCGLPAPTLV